MRKVLVDRNFRIYLSIGLGILCLILIYLAGNPIQAEDQGLKLTDFLGRFHPLVVHFPIVLVLLSLAGEVLSRFTRGIISKEVNAGLLIGAVASSLLAAFMGYFLYSSGEYEGDLVQDHLWGGVWLSIGVSVAGIAHLFELKQLKLAFLVLANMLLVYTGHIGGSLTHGEDYLTDYFTQVNPEDAPVMNKSREEIAVFEDLVIPVFKAKCLSCHNPRKTKGGLQMNTYEGLLAGGKSKKALLASVQVVEGELYRRIHLPDADEEHMPPSGKAQLTSEEMMIINWWLESGGREDQLLGDTTVSPQLTQAIESYLPRIASLQVKDMQKRAENHKISQKLIPLAESLGFVVEPDLEIDSFHFSLSMKLPPEKVTDESLIELLPFAHVISRISLVSSEITDEGLFTLSQLSELRKLSLAKTCIKGTGLIYLADLPYLETLNLSETFVDDLGAMQLVKLEQLKKVYLLNSEVSLELAGTLHAFLPEVEVLLEEGPLY